jgi:hypothetical protein
MTNTELVRQTVTTEAVFVYFCAFRGYEYWS